MIFHDNCLLADNSHEISYLILSKIRKDVAKFVVCCSREWRFKGSSLLFTRTTSTILHDEIHMDREFYILK